MQLWMNTKTPESSSENFESDERQSIRFLIFRLLVPFVGYDDECGNLARIILLLCISDIREPTIGVLAFQEEFLAEALVSIFTELDPIAHSFPLGIPMPEGN